MSILSNSNITTFYNRAAQKGFARDFQFRVTRLLGWNLGDAQNNLLYLNTATLPGRTVTVVNVPYLGLDFRVPGVAQYSGSQGWRVQLKCDESLDLLGQLTNWNAAAFNDATSQGSNIPNTDVSNTIELTTLDGRGKSTRQITLYGAWLTSIGDISYSLVGTGSVINVEATFAYQYWRVTEEAATNLVPAQPKDFLGGDQSLLSSRGAQEI